MTLAKNGFFDKNELDKLPGVPSKERLQKGPVVVIECAQKIPCNPCEEACHKNAIKIGDSIIELPVLDSELCTGCGLCIASCPGQAIFVVDMTYSETEAAVQLPFEFLPYPKQGEIVDGLDRSGETVCDAKVLKVLNPKKFDRTAVITVSVPKKFGMEVRNIKLRKDRKNG
jgi:Fe-S-cluster-containing hydrogenase component 2